MSASPPGCSRDKWAGPWPRSPESPRARCGTTAFRLVTPGAGRSEDSEIISGSVRLASAMVRSELPLLSKRRLGAFMNDNVVLVSGIAMVIATLVIRAVALGQPEVDVDEQYYLLVGSRMFHGVIPYVDIWDRKPIGLFLI